MPDVVIPEQFNAAEYFVDRNLQEGRGDNIAVLHGDQEITYREVAEKVNATGHALRSLGVEMENRVVLLLLDSPAFVYSFFGAMKIGAVPVPLNTNLTTDELLEGQPTELEAAPTSKDDPAFWLYTSGTTGYSLGAVHLHHDMLVCVQLYSEPILRIREDDRTFSIAKLFFAYGLGNALYFPFAVGASTVLYPGRPESRAVFDVVNRYRPTVFYGVPTAYAAMLHAAESGADVDMSSVRIAVSAGEPLPASIYERWLERFGVEILDGIGSTEILHIFLSNREGEARPGSSGQLVPGYEAMIVDDAGEPVPAGEIGNLWIKGDSIAAYYWNKHDATKHTFQGDWIRTGDKYRVDEEGYYWYAGRANDMLKVGGIWVSPTEVESAIIEHPRVLECAVVGQADAEGLIKPKAFVVLKDAEPDEGLAAEIQEFVKGRIAPYKYPRWVEFVPELPKTATGKIQRFKLRA